MSARLLALCAIILPFLAISDLNNTMLEGRDFNLHKKFSTRMGGFRALLRAQQAKASNNNDPQRICHEVVFIYLSVRCRLANSSSSERHSETPAQRARDNSGSAGAARRSAPAALLPQRQPWLWMPPAAFDLQVSPTAPLSIRATS